MSFKRDGDDKCALDSQRKKRVTDLLYEDIEEGEVIRLSNGKYKCKRCSHQPMFDTLNMFYVHKQGKKHLRSMEYAAKQEEDLKDLVEMRKHDNLITPVANQNQDDQGTAEGIPKTILGIKKRKRPYDRKPILQFDTSADTRGLSSVSVETARHSKWHGNSNYSSKISEGYSDIVNTSNSPDTNKLTVAKLLPRIADNITSRSNTKIQCKQQQAPRSASESIVVNARDVHKFVRQSNAEQNNRYYLSRKNQREETSSSQIRNKDGKVYNKSIDKATVPTRNTWDFYKDVKGKLPYKTKCIQKYPSNDLSCETREHRKVETPDNLTTGIGGDSCTEEKERVEKYLKAIGCGWKKDWTGAWVKDEDVEFDSDEEPPDIP